MTQHTHGPLVVATSSSGINRMIISLDRVPCIAETYNEGAAENARRLVACWNACDGIDTAMLEGFSSRFLSTYPDRVLAERRALESQRDELLKLLTRLSAAAAARDTTMGDQCALFAAQSELRDANKLAFAAITKAGGAA